MKMEGKPGMAAMANNYWKQLEMAGNSFKWLEIAGTNSKWLERAGMDENGCQNINIFCFVY